MKYKENFKMVPYFVIIVYNILYLLYYMYEIYCKTN
jgi:hypothetical protein